jgi:hypothetical protein
VVYRVLTLTSHSGFSIDSKNTLNKMLIHMFVSIYFFFFIYTHISKVLSMSSRKNQMSTHINLTVSPTETADVKETQNDVQSYAIEITETSDQQKQQTEEDDEAIIANLVTHLKDPKTPLSSNYSLSDRARAKNADHGLGDTPVSVYHARTLTARRQESKINDTDILKPNVQTDEDADTDVEESPYASPVPLSRSLKAYESESTKSLV